MQQMHNAAPFTCLRASEALSWPLLAIFSMGSMWTWCACLKTWCTHWYIVYKHHYIFFRIYKSGDWWMALVSGVAQQVVSYCRYCHFEVGPASEPSLKTNLPLFFFSSRAQPQKQPLSQCHITCQLLPTQLDCHWSVTELSDPLLIIAAD